MLMLIISESNKLLNGRVNCSVFFSLIEKVIYEVIKRLGKINYVCDIYRLKFLSKIWHYIHL